MNYPPWKSISSPQNHSMYITARPQIDHIKRSKVLFGYQYNMSPSVWDYECVLSVCHGVGVAV